MASPRLRRALRFIRHSARSAPARAVDLLDARVHGRFYDSVFEGVELYCGFIGCSRSGHSLVGALLDAHPDAVIAHELDAMGLAGLGITPRSLHYLILKNSRRQQVVGRLSSDFRYAVPGQWQGRFRNLRVIGDKMAGRTMDWYRRFPRLLHRLERSAGRSCRFVHVVRNPLDNIATMARRNRRNRPVRGADLDYAVDWFFARMRASLAFRAEVGDRVHTLWHEAMVAEPRETLSSLCRFLSLEPHATYLDASAEIVRPRPNLSRDAAPWRPGHLADIERQSAAFPFLERYLPEIRAASEGLT